MVADCVKETYPARFQSAENLLNNISDLQDEDWKWVGSATTRFNYRLVAADDSRIVSLDDPRLGIVTPPSPTPKKNCARFETTRRGGESHIV
jgi:hypothetical protein